MAKRYRQAIAALTLVALALYAYYEAGISSYTDISVDLLLVWPALMITAVLGIRSAITLLSQRTAK